MAEPKQKTKNIAGLRVSAKVDGFRRAGRAWSATPQDVPASDFNKTQIAALKDCPEITVAEVDVEIVVE